MIAAFSTFPGLHSLRGLFPTLGSHSGPGRNFAINNCAITYDDFISFLLHFHGLRVASYYFCNGVFGNSVLITLSPNAEL